MTRAGAVPSRAEDRPVVFLRGRFPGADAWAPWEALFAAHGYAPLAPRWPGEGPPGRAGFGARPGTEALTDHYARLISGLWSPPIVIGHGLGGLIAQRLLALDYARGGAAIAPVPARGLRRRAAWLRATAPRLDPRTRDTPTATGFRRRFANTLTRSEAEHLWTAHARPAPVRPLRAALAARPSAPAARPDPSANRGPLLLVAAAEDRVVPPADVRAAYRVQRRGPGPTEYLELPGRGHTLALDHRWPEVALLVLAFLARHGLAATDPLPGPR
ncbi:alpha/beta hydrolase [Streptomyces sp. NPDC005805]|uniref:alpha/beta hydrolase n=1 Tax=Streptomyces sp. NPDC005805 TaxID=3157068 RepID=UPI0033D5AFE4